MTLIKLTNLANIQPGKILQVSTAKEKIILLEHKGKIKSYQAHCPHEGGPLAEGHIENGQLVCPLHQWQFSCANGKNYLNKACLKAFPLIIKEGSVFIEDHPLEESKINEEHTSTVTIEDLPSPKKSLLFGHLPQFKAKSKHKVLERWAEESGEVYKINLLDKKFVVSTDPNLNHQVLKLRPDQFRRFYKISEIMEEMGILGVLNTEGERWKNHRKLTSEALNLKNVKGFFPTISKITNRLFNKLKKLEAGQIKVDVQKEMMRYTVDITTAIAFGYPMNTLDKEKDVIQNHLEKIFPMVNKRLTSPLAYWRLIKFKQDKELDLALLEIEKIIMKFISDAKNRLKQEPELKNKPTNFLEALLVEQEREGNFSDLEVFGNVFTLLLAGEDTTSNSISWALYYLAQNSEIIKKVRKESFEIFPEHAHAIKYEDINKLKYTEAVAMEAIRLKPVTPTMHYQALEDLKINNFYFKKGTTIILQNKVPQTHEDNFIQAKHFIPERWINTGCPVHGTHKPEVIKAFGGGPRYCPGKNLAMHEMIMALSMICKNFDLEFAVDPEEVQEVHAFTMYPDNLWINFKPIPPSPANLEMTGHQRGTRQ
ncbi:cytochrome P450 [Xanthovirga aplysinae]|uniref:cytochrome P450 n=1 Tax=Xanthovirga aplysinae TaxID=2529853 RepID=UPI0012BD5F26|nr:cytochrome P450 [Xanthovirga aplysinae]MTI29726.1 cytochrome P450 [Xanthovirga aplysinae]